METYLGKIMGDTGYEFQKDLIVWKQAQQTYGIEEYYMFQKDLIVWKPPSLQFLQNSHSRFRRT